jgi:hypothetical protein
MGTVRSSVWTEQGETAIDSKGAESTVQAESVRKITIPVPFAHPDKRGLHHSLLNRMIAAFEESGLRTELSEKLSVRSLKQLAHSVRASEAVYIPLFTVQYPSLLGFLMAVTGRFYKKPVIVHFVNQEYSRRSLTNRFRIVILKQLANTVIFTNTESKLSNTDKEISADFIAPVTESASGHTSLQPRIATLLDEASLPALIVVVKAFTAVKQKYPRAELVLLYDANDAASVAAVTTYADTPGIILQESSACASFSETPVSADMVVDFSALSGDRTSLMTALSEGVSVVSFQSPESMSVVTDGVEGVMLERLDRSFLAGRIIKMIEQPEAVSAMSSEAIRLARRFAPSHFAQSFTTLIDAIHA